MGYINTDRLFVTYFTAPVWHTRPFAHTVIHRPEIDNPSQDEVKAQQMEQKQQRAKLSQKRHKSKTFHVNKKKDVPPFLQNLVKKA